MKLMSNSRMFPSWAAAAKSFLSLKIHRRQFADAVTEKVSSSKTPKEALTVSHVSHHESPSPQVFNICCMGWTGSLAHREKEIAKLQSARTQAQVQVRSARLSK